MRVLDTIGAIFKDRNFKDLSAQDKTLYIDDIRYDENFRIKFVYATYNRPRYIEGYYTNDIIVPIPRSERVSRIQGRNDLDDSPKGFDRELSEEYKWDLSIKTYQELHEYYKKEYKHDLGPCPGGVTYCNFYEGREISPYYIYDPVRKIIIYSDSREKLIKGLNLQP